jgi:hypothetical protein
VRPVCAVMTAALMIAADEVPFCFAGFDALDITAGCSRPRSDRFAITSHGPRNLFARYRADREVRSQATAEPSAGIR